MTYPQLNQHDEDALFDYINGENDALILETPTSTDYYYLKGWYDTKAKLARGELTEQLETIASCSINASIDDWEVF